MLQTSRARSVHFVVAGAVVIDGREHTLYVVHPTYASPPIPRGPEPGGPSPVAASPPGSSTRGPKAARLPRLGRGPAIDVAETRERPLPAPYEAQS